MTPAGICWRPRFVDILWLIDLPTNHNTAADQQSTLRSKLVRSSPSISAALECAARDSMTSPPPRRMTRARAKVEGYEPDWKINPQWKTPKKPKSTRFAEPDQETGTLKNSIIAGGAERVPSPTKIRITAKLPIQQKQPAQASGTPTRRGSQTASISRESEGLRKSVLSSPVRVRSIQIRSSVSDKENSPVRAFTAWGTAKQPVSPRATSVASRPRPLEASPTVVNTAPQTTSVKVLSTPIRVLNPHTPGRLLGSARRIPIKVDKAKSQNFALNTSANQQESKVPPDLAHVRNLRLSCPGTSIMSATIKTASPPKSRYCHELEFIDPVPKKSTSNSQLSGVNTPELAMTPEQFSDTHWTPLKPIPPLQRNLSIGTKSQLPPPSKPQQDRQPSLQLTKRDFCVDESISIPLKTESIPAKRSATQLPRFPIRRRSTSQPVSPNEESLPELDTELNKTALGLTRDFIPVDRADKGIFHTKAAGQLPGSRKSEYRTLHTMVDTASKSLVHSNRSPPVPTIPPSSAQATASNSTTPCGTPQDLSLKIFNFSDTELSAIQLFTPRKSKSSAACQTNNEKRVHTYKSTFADQQTPQRTKTISPPSAIVPSLQVPSLQNPTLHDNRDQRTTPFYEIGTTQRHPQDIMVPIKDSCSLTVVGDARVASPIASTKSILSNKSSIGALQGVTAYVDVRTADGDDAGAPFIESLKNMGAKVVRHWTWNGEELDRNSVTHVIFKEGGPRTLSKVKLAKGAVKCVGLAWISRCEAEGAKVDETPFIVEMPSGAYGHKRRKSMEPRALLSGNSTPFKDMKEKEKPDVPGLDKAQRALSELSINRETESITPIQSASLHLARRKSLQHAPIVSSPLARKSWTVMEH